MGDNILFKQGKLASLPAALESGQILFAINDNDINNVTGSIYLDYKDGDTARRAKLNADATKLATPISVTIGSNTKSLNTDLGNTVWTHNDIGANVSLTYTSDSTSGPTITSLVNGVSDSFTFPSASSTVSGVVNTGTQTFSGGKTFNNAIAFRNNIIIGSVNSATSVNNSYTNHNLIFVRPRNNSSSNYAYGTFTLYTNNYYSLNLQVENQYNYVTNRSGNNYTIATDSKGNYSFSDSSFYANFYQNGRSLGSYNSNTGKYAYNYYNCRDVLNLGTGTSPWGSLYLANHIALGNTRIWNNTYQGNRNSNNPYYVTAPNITLYYGDNTYNASNTSAPYQYLKTILSTTLSSFYVQVGKYYVNSNSANTNASYSFGLNAFYTNATKDLGTTNYYWNCGYIKTVYGDLYGNANTATTLETPINFTIGNTSKIFDGSVDMSWPFNEIGADISKFDWTSGTTAGPILNLTLNGIPVTATIPSASETESGVVVTGEQTFSGNKTFISPLKIQEYRVDDGCIPASLSFITSTTSSNKHGEFKTEIEYLSDDVPVATFTLSNYHSPTSSSNFSVNMDMDNIFPRLDGSKNLGISDHKWNYIYANKFIGSQAEISDTTRTNRLVITNTSSGVKHLEFSRTNYNYIWAPSGGSIAFSPDGRELNAQTEGATFVVSTGNQILSPSNAILGSANAGFSKVYSDIYIVDNTVTLQYNSISEALEFVFA